MNESGMNDEDDITNTNLFFWSLPFTISEEALYKLCAYYGHVRSLTIKRSIGENNQQTIIAFVTMDTHEQAQLVIQKLYNYHFEVIIDSYCNGIELYNPTWVGKTDT